MNMRNTRTLLPVAVYLGILLVLGLSIFVGMGFVVKDKSESLNLQIREMRNKSTRQELITAIRLVSEDLERTRSSLLNWDEVRQQLDNPRYYDYWRQNRLFNAAMLPSGVDACELYDKERRILAPSKQGLPDVLNSDLFGVVARKNHKTTDFYYAFPVAGLGDHNEILGYVLLRMPMVSALRSTSALQTIEPEQIEDNLREGATVALTELLPLLTTPAIETPAAAELSKLVSNALRDFIIAVALLSMLIWLVVIYLFVHPLRRLSAYIDNLRQHSAEPRYTVKPRGAMVKEIDKAYESLHAYQQQLAQSNSELKLNESTLRTILDNVPDGIFSLDKSGRILSCNRAACSLFGMTLSELYHHKFNDLFNSGTEDNPGIFAIRRDGSRFHAETTFSDYYDSENSRIVIVRDITDRKHAEARLMQLANYDPLTGLPNRTLMRDRLLHAIQHARRNHSQLGLIFLDLDRFKNVNDTLGHQYGDGLLKEVASRLETTVRDSDTVARIGGDEFTIIVENIIHVNDLTDIAASVLECVATPITIEGRAISVSTSLGITLYPSDGDDPDRLIKNADTAMYRAKELGRNNYQYFTEEMNTRAMERLELEHELRQALQKNEFMLYFQPRIDMKTNTIIGAEALVRWKHPRHGIVLPGRFISIMEDTGMIIQLGEWVIRTAAQQLRQWIDVGIDHVRISLNLSARQFQDKALVELLREVLNEHDLPAHLLEMEITESLLMENQASAIQILENFHDMGVSISIDDFGTGYSSLSYLMQFPIDTIKIDRSFISGVPQDKDACLITKSIIALAKNMMLRVTAEGIETPVQAQFLREIDCDEGQGYHYAKPMPAKELQQILQGPVKSTLTSR